MSKERIQTTDPIALLREMVAIPSYVKREGDGSYEANETHMGEFVADYIRRNTDMVVETQEVVDGRFNVIARGKGPTSVMMLGHLDTVQPRQGYKHPPFSAVVEDGKLYGLGSCDMKSGISSILTAAATVEKTDGLMLLFYIDEEYDFAGMKAYVQKVPEDLRPKIIVSADGEEMEVMYACRGLIEVSGFIRGESGHAGRSDSGKNAIYKAVDAIREVKAHLAKQFVSPQMGTTTLNLAYLRGGLDDGLDKDGVRQFGKEGNNIPDLAQFVIDVRPATPDLNAQQILEMIEASCKEQKVELEETSIRHDLGAWLSPIEDAQDALDIIRQQVGTVNLKDPGSFVYVDVAMLWQKLRRSAVVVGPGAPGTAPSNNEHVVEDEVYKAAELFKRIIEKYQR